MNTHVVDAGDRKGVHAVFLDDGDVTNTGAGDLVVNKDGRDPDGPGVKVIVADSCVVDDDGGIELVDDDDDGI